MFSSESEFLQNVIKSARDLVGIVFVDAENVPKYLENILRRRDELLKRVSCKNSSKTIHFAFTFSPDRYYSHIQKISSRNQLDAVSFLQSRTRSKDAVDFTITFYASTLNVLLPMHVVFFFVTSDHFADDILAHLTALGRRCERIDPLKEDLIVKSLSSPSNNTESVVSSTSSETLEKLKIEVATSNKLEPLKPSPSLSTPTKSLSENELKALYYSQWKSTQSEFCRIYNIDGSNFSKWLRNKKSSPASARAVRAWLSSLQQNTPAT
jgi:hypothetical protein